jgi:endogenous inhibitor of DNA gyrase (YacG/DUF329 family)
MTGEQKQTIQDMRRQGVPYTRIADALGISVNTIKSYGRRNILPTTRDAGDGKNTCKHCGKRLKQAPKAKPRTFCCDKCRFDWWNAHRDTQRTAHSLICAYCGAVFTSHDKNRKYCGHPCYIAARFPKGAC